MFVCFYNTPYDPFNQIWFEQFYNHIGDYIEILSKYSKCLAYNWQNYSSYILPIVVLLWTKKDVEYLKGPISIDTQTKI